MAAGKTAFEIIKESLDNYPGQQKMTAEHRMICCPYHDDSSPSLGIYVADGTNVPLGSFNCFGCEASGSWNKLAEKLGFPTFKDWNTSFKENTTLVEVEVEDQTIASIMTSLRSGYTEWPSNRKWRGFNGDVIREVGGLLIDDSYTKGIGVFFPVYIGRILRGGVKAAMKKIKGRLSYVTTKGTWIKKYGLFLFEPVKALKLNYVVVVEGPRDALRLYIEGIPAIAILGSQNFGAAKALMLSALFPDFVICLPDNDEAGKKMKKLVKAHMSKYCPVYSVTLPEGVKDPAEMDDDDIEDLKTFIKRLNR